MPKTSPHLRNCWKNSTAKCLRMMKEGVGFSFSYGGKISVPDSADWTITTRETGISDRTEIVFEHASGLIVVRSARLHPTFDAVEYFLRFKNVSEKTLPVISALHALNVLFDEPFHEGTSIVSSGGGMAESTLPPANFAIRRQLLSTISEYPASVELTTDGGRSSNKDLPFFFVHNEGQKAGAFVAVGWSGQWAAAAFADPIDRAINLRGKIPGLEIALEPGEEIQGPTILIGFYDGDLAAGSNKLRRLIRDTVTPALGGRKMSPVAVYDTWFGVNLSFDEALLRKLADKAAAIGQEYFLLDAGWYAGTKGDTDFGPGVGNWFEIDREKLPHGIEPIAEYVRSKGMEFGLWFEPERVARDSQLAREHPEWILWDQLPEEPSWWMDLYPDYFKTRYGLLDFGRTDVQRWVCDMMDHYIRACGVKYVRYDFNLDPLPYWEASDKPGRRGVAQLRHIHGLYEVIDWVRQRHPETILEGCASGGRRIDLETARRFHTALISDHTADPAIIRHHLYGINHFLPGNYHYVIYTQPISKQAGFEPHDLGFQSLYAGAFGTGGRADLWSKEMTQKLQRHVGIWKKLRHYLMEDFYPLSSQPQDLKSWLAWQFHDPTEQSGFIQTFRMKTTGSSQRFALHGLDASRRYRFVDLETEATFELPGTETLTYGVEIEQPMLSCRVLMYQQLPLRARDLAAIKS